MSVTVITNTNDVYVRRYTADGLLVMFIKMVSVLA